MKKYNVLFLLHDSVLNGGATRSLLDVIVELKQKKLIEPIILYPDKDKSILKLLEEYKIKSFNIKYSVFFYNKNQNIVKKIKFYAKVVIKEIISYFNYFKIKKIIKENKIDLVYSNTMTISMGCFLKRKLNIPHIWHIREFGEEDHGLSFPFGEKKFKNLLNKYTDKVIVISNALKNKYINFLEDKSKIEVFYDDVSKDFINPKEKFNLSDTLNIAMIGTISEGKGQLEVIKAIEKLKDKKIRLYIAGERNGKPYDIMIEKYVKDNNLSEKVKFVGYIRDTNSFRRKMDVGVIASKSEAFGRTTIEGMLSQMLIIASNKGSNVELIENGKNGYIYELHNEDELSKIILNIYENRKLIKEISVNGYNYAQKFTQGKTAISIYNLIKILVNKGERID